jgi:cyclopropane fatty-acyl-phospholipid synthase-like methyltransferase
MDDLLRLECGNFKNINFIGVDLDEEALTLALGNAQNLGYEDQLSLVLQDAWELAMDQAVDVIISNGLTAYEQDHSRNLSLFKRFHRALKPGGTLITSFWTPPPSQGNLCPWRNYDVEDVMLQKAIFSDILNARWLSYLTEEEATGILANAGFKVERIIHDSQSMCPTVVAKRV